MLREMFRGMSIGRAVATADMTTGQTETEMHPGRSRFEAFLTALGASGHGMKIGRVRTGHISPPRAEEQPCRRGTPIYLSIIIRPGAIYYQTVGACKNKRGLNPPRLIGR